MSEPTGTEQVPPQPGWWQASDGKWYPPEQAPGSPAPPPPGAYTPPAYAPPASNGLATASMVTGIVAVVLFWAFGLSTIVGIVAVILGAVGLSKANALPNQTGRGQAIAGIVTGAIGAVAGIVIVIAGIAALGDAAEVEFREVGEELESGDFEGINTDPSDGSCDGDRFLQDPDC